MREATSLPATGFMSANSDLVPCENLGIFRLIYVIEVALREFIIEGLESQCGPRWMKERLPGDVLEVVRRARAYERSIKWQQLVPHHPIYYIDFPDLKKVIQRADNWTDVFRSVFGRRDLLIETLSELEPIRNKVAHNRKASAGDLRIAEAGYEKIASCLGEKRLIDLASRCTMAADIGDQLRRLREEAESSLSSCLACRPLAEVGVWHTVRHSWWFDTDYLGEDVGPVEEYFGTVDSYRELPRPRGSGHKIEAWVKANDLPAKCDAALEVLSALIRELE